MSTNMSISRKVTLEGDMVHFFLLSILRYFPFHVVYYKIVLYRFLQSGKSNLDISMSQVRLSLNSFLLLKLLNFLLNQFFIEPTDFHYLNNKIVHLFVSLSGILTSLNVNTMFIRTSVLFFSCGQSKC